MKRLSIILLASATAFSCSSPKEKAPQIRNIASKESIHEQNLKILSSIPLLKGVEVKTRDEDSIAASLVEIFNKIADENKNSNQSLNRGTHAKGSCFNGQIQVYSKDDLKSKFSYPGNYADALLQGVFSFKGTYPIQIRFANAKGGRFPDTANDVRALSFSMETSNEIFDYSGKNRLDFMMNSSPMFAVNNIVEFYELMKAARLGQKDFSYFPNPLYLQSTIRAANLLKTYERNDIKSYTTEMYWGNLPYLSGVNENGTAKHFVKYRVIPCNGKGIQKEASAGKSATYLQDDIKAKVEKNEVCFYLQAQVFDLKKLSNTAIGPQKRWSTSQWIENGGAEWDEKVLPFYTLAKIEVPKTLNENIDSDELCKENYINTRLHATSANRPVGSLARVRTFVEENSRARRMGEID
nr:catalase [Bacteriovorax sp. HI3]